MYVFLLIILVIDNPNYTYADLGYPKRIYEKKYNNWGRITQFVNVGLHTRYDPRTDSGINITVSGVIVTAHTAQTLNDQILETEEGEKLIKNTADHLHEMQSQNILQQQKLEIEKEQIQQQQLQQQLNQQQLDSPTQNMGLRRKIISMIEPEKKIDLNDVRSIDEIVDSEQLKDNKKLKLLVERQKQIEELINNKDLPEYAVIASIIEKLKINLGNMDVLFKGQAYVIEC